MVELVKRVTGFELPSDSPLFFGVLSVHVLLGLACVVLGVAAMLSAKGRGNHPKFGTIYYWGLGALFATSTMLAAMRWGEDYHLFILGALSFSSATVGRAARRRLWPRWVDFHVSGMGLSYILMLTAFYVDNGKNLPLWRDLPYAAYWVVPGAVGLPLILRALTRWHRRHDETFLGQSGKAVLTTRS